MARRGTLEDSWNEMNSFQGYLQTFNKLLCAFVRVCVNIYVNACVARAYVFRDDCWVQSTGIILWLWDFFLISSRRWNEIWGGYKCYVIYDCSRWHAAWTPERTGFHVFCKRLNSSSRVPCKNTTTKALHKKYLKLCDLIKEELGKTENVTLTLDIWTNKQYCPKFFEELQLILWKMVLLLKCIGLILWKVSCHQFKFFLAQFLLLFFVFQNLKCVLLNWRQSFWRKTIENLKVIIESCCNKWNINSEKVIAAVTDEGQNIKGAVKAVFEDTKHISCFGHTLNLIGTKAIGLYDKKTRPSEIEYFEMDPNVPERDQTLMMKKTS